jgi:hypothetical protein
MDELERADHPVFASRGLFPATREQEASWVPVQRKLSEIEEQEARRVFASSLDYSKATIVEGAAWPDTVARIGSRLSNSPPPAHNAITLGNRAYFPVQLRTDLPFEEPAFLSDMSWLVHELTHAWQYQHSGPKYLLQALWAQIRLGGDAYAYGWEQGLKQAALEGKNLLGFNREQQGDIARHYYYRLRQGLDTSAWEPFVLQFQMP